MLKVMINVNFKQLELFFLLLLRLFWYAHKQMDLSDVPFHKMKHIVPCRYYQVILNKSKRHILDQLPGFFIIIKMNFLDLNFSFLLST